MDQLTSEDFGIPDEGPLGVDAQLSQNLSNVWSAMNTEDRGKHLTMSDHGTLKVVELYKTFGRKLFVLYWELTDMYLRLKNFQNTKRGAVDLAKIFTNTLAALHKEEFENAAANFEAKDLLDGTDKIIMMCRKIEPIVKDFGEATFASYAAIAGDDPILAELASSQHLFVLLSLWANGVKLSATGAIKEFDAVIDALNGSEKSRSNAERPTTPDPNRRSGRTLTEWTPQAFDATVATPEDHFRTATEFPNVASAMGTQFVNESDATALARAVGRSVSIPPTMDPRNRMPIILNELNQGLVALQLAPHMRRQIRQRTSITDQALDLARPQPRPSGTERTGGRPDDGPAFETLQGLFREGQRPSEGARINNNNKGARINNKDSQSSASACPEVDALLQASTLNMGDLAETLTGKYAVAPGAPVAAAKAALHRLLRDAGVSVAACRRASGQIAGSCLVQDALDQAPEGPPQGGRPGSGVTGATPGNSAPRQGVGFVLGNFGASAMEENPLAQGVWNALHAEGSGALQALANSAADDVPARLAAISNAARAGLMSEKPGADRQLEDMDMVSHLSLSKDVVVNHVVNALEEAGLKDIHDRRVLALKCFQGRWTAEASLAAFDVLAVRRTFPMYDAFVATLVKDPQGEALFTALSRRQLRAFQTIWPHPQITAADGGILDYFAWRAVTDG